MAINVPEWLNKEFIKIALQGDEYISNNNTIDVDRMEVDRPISKGDNYLGDILRVKAEYKKSGKDSSKISLIIKLPLEGFLFSSNTGIQEKEVKFYKYYVPRLNMLLGGDKITPKSYFSSKDKILVLEDLKANGYKMADRHLQLDYDHCVIALKKLAKFHAASVKLHKDDAQLVEDVGKEIFFQEHQKEKNEGFGKMHFSLIAEQCQKVSELSRFTNKLLEYSESSWGFLMELMKPKHDSINVLNHGDFWVNNIMFRYENDKPVDLKIIDFQICRYTWPSVDLMYFFYSSIQEKVRELRKKDLLNIYLKELNLNLEELGLSERLTQSDLKQMMVASEFFGLLVSVSLYPIIISDPKDGVLDFTKVTPEMLMDPEKNPFKPFYQSKQFLETIPKRLEYFEKHGWF